jgi:hypothetical protein
MKTSLFQLFFIPSMARTTPPKNPGSLKTTTFIPIFLSRKKYLSSSAAAPQRGANADEKQSKHHHNAGCG